ncbi:MAG TPA: hypothetical protein VFJ62_07210 [Usitatibacter sp.]|nr:hypothetical protein [Usitatibacter sp.]
MRARAIAVALVAAVAAGNAAALDEAQWPPPGDVAARMHELQQAIISPESSMAQREAAREELANLLRSPAGQGRGTGRDQGPQRPARAAIQPFPSVVKPVERVPTPVPPADVAHVEVVEPPKAVTIVPSTGQAVRPTPNDFAVDSHGRVLHPVPGGYLDPRTGVVSPR